MNQQNEAQQAQMDQQPERSAQKALSRRKFLTQASVASLPVLMSLKSGDAWGCVPLNCTGGDGNWSGTASAVSSVKQRETGDGTINPIFDSLYTIKRVVKFDLGLSVESTLGYLWEHIRNLTYKTKINGSYVYRYVYLDVQSDLSKFTAANIKKWADDCAMHSGDKNLYNGTNKPSLFTISASSPLRKPLVFRHNGVDYIICSNTEMKNFFPLMKKKLWQCLTSSTATKLEMYVTAAFVGSLWQGAEIWNTPYASSVKSSHKPNCYPDIGVLLSAYKNVILDAPNRKVTAAEAGEDMGRMFKAYTKL